jgi:hypothetical protein
LFAVFSDRKKNNRLLDNNANGIIQNSDIDLGRASCIQDSELVVQRGGDSFLSTLGITAPTNTNVLTQAEGTISNTPTAVEDALRSTEETGIRRSADGSVTVGAPIKSFVEFGAVAAAHPKDIWLDNVALTIPPSNVGITDIVFVDAGRPQQCYLRCKDSPFCRFFSYWQETGSCNMYQTLQNGETTPENMIKYAYTVPFSQHWTSGYVRKTGSAVPPYEGN